MPLAVIEGGVFGAKVVGHGIARRKPPAHLLDAGLASLGSGVCRSSGSTVRGILGSGGCGSLSGATRYVLNGKVRASFNVFFIK